MLYVCPSRYVAWRPPRGVSLTRPNMRVLRCRKRVGIPKIGPGMENQKASWMNTALFWLPLDWLR